MNKKFKFFRNLAATMILTSALSVGYVKGFVQFGAWPPALGGTYLSADCDCTNYPDDELTGMYHWVACQTKDLWGLRTTGWSAPAIHEGSCQSCGH